MIVQRNEQRVLLQAVSLAAGLHPAPWFDVIGVPGLETCSGQEFSCGTSRGMLLGHVSSQPAHRDPRCSQRSPVLAAGYFPRGDPMVAAGLYRAARELLG